MRRLTNTVLVALTALVIGCGPSVAGGGDDDDDSGGGPGTPDARPGGGGPDEFADAAVQEPCDAIDLLFVIDDSGSMRHERDNLRANFPGFIAALDAFRNETGNPIDYRVGVTSTTRDYTYIDRRPIIGDITVPVDGADGELLQGCGRSRRWLERGDPGLTDDFACIADLDAAAGLLEMPLYAADAALGRRAVDGTNAGFLRDDALLAIVIVTDEDDCSREDDNFVLDGGSDKCTGPDWPELVPVADYAARLDAVKSGRGRWAVAAIGGVCEDDTHAARPAVRLQAFVDEAGDNGVFTSICAGGDLTGALTEALATFESACEALPPIL